jgi:hypothetical protein
VTGGGPTDNGEVTGIDWLIRAEWMGVASWWEGAAGVFAVLG